MSVRKTLRDTKILKFQKVFSLFLQFFTVNSNVLYSFEHNFAVCLEGKYIFGHFWTILQVFEGFFILFRVTAFFPIIVARMACLNVPGTSTQRANTGQGLLFNGPRWVINGPRRAMSSRGAWGTQSFIQQPYVPNPSSSYPLSAERTGRGSSPLLKELCQSVCLSAKRAETPNI